MGNFAMWCWRMMEISWTDHVRNEVLESRSRGIFYLKCKNGRLTGLVTFCILEQVIEGRIQWGIEVKGRRGRRRRKLLDGLKERRGYFYLKEEALDRFRSQIATHHVTKHNTPIHNILSTAPHLSISQKALGTLTEDGNVMPKHVGATIHN
jgi:hypothetical protein